MPRTAPHDDRGGGLRTFPRERLSFGQNQVDAGGIDPVERLDRPGKLSLQRAQTVDLLHEGVHAQAAALVEQLPPRDAVTDQPLTGQLHPGAGQVFLRNGDDGAGGVDLYREPGPLERGNHARGVGRGEVAVERGVARLQHGAYAEDQGKDQHYAGCPKGDKPPLAQSPEIFQQGLHVAPKFFSRWSKNRRNYS